MTLALATLLLLVSAGTALLALGLHNGDHPDDARVIASVTARAHAMHATITIENPADGVLIASAAVIPASRLLRRLAFDDARSTALLPRPTLRGLELLGAVEAGSARTWSLPVRLDTTAPVRIRIRLEQPGGRTRILTLLRDAPSVPAGITPSRTHADAANT